MSFLKRSPLLLLLPMIAAIHCKKNDSDGSAGNVAIKDSVIASGLTHPWEILWGADDHIWITQRGGQISRLNPSTGTVTPVFTITEVVSNGEGGLLGMVLHPNFNTTPHVFVVYNYNNSGYKEKVVRFTYNGTTLISPTPIIDNIAAASIHNGSRLLIHDNKLFISTGDAANTSLPQNASSVNGKILRLNLDGTVPADNPVAGNPYWSLGHRNPQGLVFANNKLYSSEHGPSSDDEINIIEKARNYGWPNVPGFCDAGAEQTFCANNNVKEPIQAWTPTIATAGLDYYNHDEIPQWKNSLLLATLKDETLYQLKLDGSFSQVSSVTEYLNNDHGRLRDICISPAGRVYVCTSNGSNDKIIEIRKQ